MPKLTEKGIAKAKKYLSKRVSGKSPYKKEEEPDKPKKVVIKDQSDNSDIVVGGIDKVKVNLANCCNPVPGDEIISYITKGNGISIHRKECHNLEFLDNRTVKVEWNEVTNKKYTTTINIYSKSKNNNLMDILQKLNILDIHIDRLISFTKDDQLVYEIDMLVNDTKHLEKAFIELKKLSYITNIERVIR